MEHLDIESKDVLKEAFLADPTWSTKASMYHLLINQDFSDYISIPVVDIILLLTPFERALLLQQGNYRAQTPTDIRAGRLMIELFTKEVALTSDFVM